MPAWADGPFYQLDLGKDVPVNPAAAPGGVRPDPNWVSIHVQAGTPFQVIEPFPFSPSCTFYLDPMSRHVFSNETYHLVPESLLVELFVTNKPSSQIMEMKFLSKGKSAIYMVFCEDRTGAKSFDDEKKREQAIKSIFGELARNFTKVPAQDWTKLQQKIASERPKTHASGLCAECQTQNREDGSRPMDKKEVSTFEGYQQTLHAREELRKDINSRLKKDPNDPEAVKEIRKYLDTGVDSWKQQRAGNWSCDSYQEEPSYRDSPQYQQFDSKIEIDPRFKALITQMDALPPSDPQWQIIHDQGKELEQQILIENEQALPTNQLVDFYQKQSLFEQQEDSFFLKHCGDYSIPSALPAEN